MNLCKHDLLGHATRQKHLPAFEALHAVVLKCLCWKHIDPNGSQCASDRQVRSFCAGNDPLAGVGNSHCLCVQAARLRQEEEPSARLGPRFEVHRLTAAGD